MNNITAQVAGLFYYELLHGLGFGTLSMTYSEKDEVIYRWWPTRDYLGTLVLVGHELERLSNDIRLEAKARNDAHSLREAYREAHAAQGAPV